MAREVPLKPKAADCISILQLSDLHFPATYAAHPERCKWVSNFHNVLKARIELQKIDIVIVTGDLLDNEAWNAGIQTSALEAAKKYLHQLCKLCDVEPSSQLIVIPGNHDYKWKGILTSRRSRDEFNLALKDYAEDRYFTYADDLAVLLACFDSNIVRYKAELAMGCVDRTEINAREKEFNSLGQGRRVTKIGLVHHHPLPVPTSENLDPDSLPEKSVGRVLVGAPEFMIFRNAGTFIEKLLELRFRAVLHGHLHHRGYLRVSKQVKGREQSLEVFSAASLGSPPKGHWNSFHLLQVQHDGELRSLTYEFDVDGHTREPIDTPTLGYPSLRPIWWDECRSRPSHGSQEGAVGAAAVLPPQTPPTTNVVCELHEKIWEVELPRGDVTATDVFTGMRSRNGTVDSVPLAINAGMLTAHEIQAVVPGSPGRVRAEIIPVGGKEASRCLLRFSPPLTSDPLTVLVILRAEGMLLSGVEDQRLAGLRGKALGWESCTQTICFPTHRLKMTLRFIPVEATPEFIYYTALDPNTEGVTAPVQESQRKEAQSETALTRGGFHNWRPELIADEERKHLLPRPQASCFVDAPLLGYRYRFWWPIPAKTQIEGCGNMLHIRAKLLSVNVRPDKGELARAFLDACIKAARETIKGAARSANANDPRLHACLFALDSDNPIDEAQQDKPRTLSSIASTAPGAALQTKRVRWGGDIIGQAFRRGVFVTFEKEKKGVVVNHVADLPPDIHYILAYPLYCYGINGSPAAVIALASTAPDSGLGVVLQSSKPSIALAGIGQQVAALAEAPAGQLAKEIFALWEKYFPDLLELPPP